MKLLLVVGAVLAISCFAESIDYCTIDCAGRPHVACNATDDLSASCPKTNDTKKYIFTADEISFILGVYNDYRNLASNGSLASKGIGPCKRMGSLIWDPELASLGGMNTRSCQYPSDKCANTVNYKNVGQSVLVVGVSATPNAKEIISSWISSSFNQYNDTKIGDMQSYPGYSNEKGKDVGKFFQIVLSNATAVGCGGTVYYQSGWYWFSVTCYYASAPIFAYPVCEASTTAASGCKNGTDATYKALCSKNEGQFNVDSTASGPFTPSINYCNVDCGGRKHVACNATDKLSTQCPYGATKYYFTPDDINAFLNMYNDYRNSTCNGSMISKGFKACAQTIKLVWNPELAYFGGLKTRSCTTSYDECRNTADCNNVGQANGAVGVASWDYPNSKYGISGILPAWFGQYVNANISQLYQSGWSANGPGGYSNNFLQMVYENARSVGCGASIFKQNGFIFMGITCNYISDPVTSKPVYTATSTPASGCRSDVDATYTALCSEYEPNVYTPSTNYCTVACGGKTHIACNTTDELPSTAPPGSKKFYYNLQVSAKIVDMVNDFRNATSNGSVMGLDRLMPCARMAKVRWNDELGYLAGVLTRQLGYVYNQCQNTLQFNNVGQSFYYGIISGDPNISDVTLNVVKGWFNQYKDVKMSNINFYRGDKASTGNNIGDFLQMVSANTTDMGCGASFYKKDGWTYVFICFMWSSSPFYTYPVYLSSVTPASNCTTGVDPYYKALCNKNEGQFGIGLPISNGSDYGDNPDNKYVMQFTPTADYCKIGAATCPSGTNHTACPPNNDDIKSTCPCGSYKYRFNKTEQDYIINAHNEFRDRICNGSIYPYAICARMATLVWDEELAYIAGMPTRTCIMAHDACRTTARFSSCGQNMATMPLNPSGLLDWNINQKTLNATVFMWCNEYKDDDMRDIDSFYRGASPGGIQVGHFTQVIWANTTTLGCGGTFYMGNNGYKTMLMACNYGPSGNWGGKPVYLRSNTPGSACTTGKNTTYKSLCSLNENPILEKQ